MSTVGAVLNELADRADVHRVAECEVVHGVAAEDHDVRRAVDLRHAHRVALARQRRQCCVYSEPLSGGGVQHVQIV